MAGGLIVDIGQPDYETRSAIVRSRCEERGVRFRSGVIEELARVSFRNVRELQGALNRLIAMQTLGDHQVSPEEVQGMLGDLAEPNARTPLSRSTAEFQALVTEVETAVSKHVERWRGRLAEAIAYWSGEGYRTAMLDRALQGDLPPQSVEGFLREYEASVNKLIELENGARELDPLLASNAVFRDPERVSDAEALVQRAQRLAAPPPGPSGAFTRAGFEVGAANQLAVRAADAVVTDPGARYNPLFIHGPSGVGKTHLINAVGNALLTSGRAGSVACVPAHAFVDELIAALQEGTVDRWRLRYRDATALLLDDVQFVEGKERTQEELFHAFNALHREGKQLVFTSDRPPRELTGLEDRLRSRFEGGLVVEMQAPDPTLCERLYARFLQEQGVKADAELLRYLASRPARSAREILGAVNALVSAAEAAGKPVTTRFARSHLEGYQTPALGTPVVRAAADPFFLDREKVIWQWNEPAARLVEEMR